MKHFGLKNGSVFVLVEAAGGVYGADALARVCAVAETHSAFLKITEDHRVGFMVLPESLGEVSAQLQSHGLFVRPYLSGGTPSPRACLGELCPHAEQDALGDAIELGAALAARFGDGERPYSTVGISGCHRACIASGLDDIHIVGEESGYKVTIGGKSREIPQLGQFVADNVPKERLAEVVGALLEVYYAGAADDERMVDLLERSGLSDFSDPVEALLNGRSRAEGDHTAPDMGSEADDATQSNNPSEPSDAALAAEDGLLESTDAQGESELDESADFEDVPLEGEDEASGAFGAGVSALSAVGEDSGEAEGSAAFDAIEGNDFDDVAAGIAAGDLEEEFDIEPSAKTHSTDFDDASDDEDAFLDGAVGDDASLAGSDSGDPEGDGPSDERDSRGTAGFDAGAKGSALATTDGTDVTGEGLAGEGSATRNEDEHGLMAEEDELDIEDASAEDLARVTSAIRAEVEPDEDTSVTAGGELGGAQAATDIDSEILAFEETRKETPPARSHPHSRAADRAGDRAGSTASQASHVAAVPNEAGSSSTRAATASRSQGRGSSGGGVSVRLDGTSLAVGLPDGTALRCPFPRAGQGDGLVIELHTAQGALRVSRDGDMVLVELGEMRLELPVSLPEAA